MESIETELSDSRSFRAVIKTYFQKLRAFQRNARFYLLYVVITGLVFGVFRLLFNFYVLSHGFDEALLGRLITVNSLTALLAALPIGYLADLLGRKRALMGAAMLTTIAVAFMVLFTVVWVFYSMNMLFGLSQSLSGVTTGPFLMENSSESERTYLFSFSMGLQMLSSFMGNWLGGYLPTWMSLWQDTAPTSSTAYGLSLAVVAGISLVGLVPLLFLRRNYRAGEEERSHFAPFSYLKTHTKFLGKMISPLLITSIGAGLVMPFMNVFFRVVHQQPDTVIGSLFAWGSLSMALGLLIAPVIADRIGKMRVVVISQALSIPFLIILGFAPWFWISAAAYYVRLGLMNMSNPVYQAFVMEHVEPESRATVASLTSMSWNAGWAFSPVISGWLQVKYGFGPAFIGTITLYSVAVIMYWHFFLRETEITPLSVTTNPG